MNLLRFVKDKTMMSLENIDILILLLTLFTAVTCIFILAILRFRLARDKCQSRKSYAALLIDANDNVDMIIPIIEQKPPSLEHYSRVIQTETLHPCVETNAEYFQSILSDNDVPYYPVREIQFTSCTTHSSPMNIDVNKSHYFIDYGTDKQNIFKGSRC